METKTVTVASELPKEAYELAIGMMNFGFVAYKQLKDGVDFSDAPPLIESAKNDLMPGLIGVDQLSDEYKDNKVGFMMAFAIAASELLEKILKEKENQG